MKGIVIIFFKRAFQQVPYISIILVILEASRITHPHQSQITDDIYIFYSSSQYGNLISWQRKRGKIHSGDYLQNKNFMKLNGFIVQRNLNIFLLFSSDKMFQQLFCNFLHRINLGISKRPTSISFCLDLDFQRKCRTVSQMMMLRWILKEKELAPGLYYRIHHCSICIQVNFIFVTLPSAKL